MSNRKWANLTDAEKGQLVSMWIIAADNNGEIPSDHSILRKVCMLDENPNINKFIELGLIESTGCHDDVNVASTWRQDDAPDQKREEERREDQILSDISPDGESVTPVVRKNNVPFQKIIDLYHDKLPMLPRVEKLTETRKGFIRQRWLEDLHEIEHWENYFEFVKKSKFLTGMCETTNGKPPFRADLEWLTRPGNFAKVAEEKYHHG